VNKNNVAITVWSETNTVYRFYSKETGRDLIAYEDGTICNLYPYEDICYPLHNQAGFIIEDYPSLVEYIDKIWSR
jgi:hypothetical protein